MEKTKTEEEIKVSALAEQMSQMKFKEKTEEEKQPEPVVLIQTGDPGLSLINQTGEEVKEVQNMEIATDSFLYEEFKRLPRENCFKGTTFEPLVVFGRTIMANQDLQAFAESVNDADNIVTSNFHNLMSIQILQWFCAREISVRGQDDYVKKIKEFPKMEDQDALSEHLKKIKTKCETAGDKSVFPIRLSTNQFLSSKTFFSKGEYTIIMVPNNIAFINGVINSLIGNCTGRMKMISNACRDIRQGKKPMPTLLKNIRESEEEKFSLWVVTKQLEENEVSQRIRRFITTGEDEEVIEYMKNLVVLSKK